MTRRVLRFTVPITGQVVPRWCGPGEIVHVDARTPDAVEFWTVVDGLGDAENGPARLFTIAGTGHVLPDLGIVRGTALPPEHVDPAGVVHHRGAGVWHLIEIPPESKSLERAQRPLPADASFDDSSER